MYNELIDALRYHADATIDELKEFLRSGCGGCEEPDDCDICELRMDDAADVIENLQAEIDRKDKALIAWLDKWEQTKGKLIDRICAYCDTPAEERLNGLCEECPIVSVIREVFDNVDHNNN